uniref:Schwann cell myelin protein-like n=1 Tax=Erpetoichthys calabaricus TaxID=27687 RepID=A0A8C4TJ59_ERPCA
MGTLLRTAFCWAALQGLLKGGLCQQPFSVPDSVAALEGSCVVIPCTFFVPSGQKARVEVTWFAEGKDRTRLFPKSSTYKVYDSLDVSSAHSNFRERATLVGNLSAGNCSLMIKKVKSGEIIKMYLEDKRRNRSPTIAFETRGVPAKPLISHHGPVREGQRNTVSCVVEHTCPGHPPVIEWKQVTGQVTLEHTEVRKGSWRMASSMTFTASYKDTSVECQATYNGEVKVTKVEKLNVTYAPKNIQIEVSPENVKEGGKVNVSCSDNANPPSFLHTLHMAQGNKIITYRNSSVSRFANVSRGTHFYCTVQNSIGQAHSESKAISIQYKPEISPESKCHVMSGKVACQCVVDSCPVASLHWEAHSRIQNQTLHFGNSTAGNVVTGTLDGLWSPELNVTCAATNPHGTSVMRMLFVHEQTDKWKIILAVAGVLSFIFILIIIIAVTVCCKRRKRASYVVHSSIPYPLYDSNIYQDRDPLYMNCVEANPVYTNGRFDTLYENCTPCFVRTMQQRQAFRKNRHLRQLAEIRILPTECPVYLEILP